MFIHRPALLIEQAFGPFYVARFTAAELRKISYSDPLRKDGDRYQGNQRMIKDQRVREIKGYVESSDCAFPNSVILAANYGQADDGVLCQDDDLRWRIDDSRLVVPTDTPMAVIIDGQHRLAGFEYASDRAQKMDLVCSVYLDLPASLQAFLFATINSTQRPVDKSLAYDLFGFDLSETEPLHWSPDKVAISICRKMNDDDVSPFFRRIKPGALNVESETEKSDNERGDEIEWQVSTSCVVSSILSLISSRPQEDKAKLSEFGRSKRIRKDLAGIRKDRSAMRELYLTGADGVLYRIVLNLFDAAMDVFQLYYLKRSALSRTIGVQAVFDVLSRYIRSQESDLRDIDFTKERFVALFSPAQHIDFCDDFFMKFSGVGRARVRDVILVGAELLDPAQIRDDASRKWIRGKLHVGSA